MSSGSYEIFVSQLIAVATMEGKERKARETRLKAACRRANTLDDHLN